MALMDMLNLTGPVELLTIALMNGLKGKTMRLKIVKNVEAVQETVAPVMVGKATSLLD